LGISPLLACFGVVGVAACEGDRVGGCEVTCFAFKAIKFFLGVVLLVAEGDFDTFSLGGIFSNCLSLNGSGLGFSSSYRQIMNTFCLILFSFSISLINFLLAAI
jgi:hypothetical protein